jgi:hypothetical protein
VIGEILRRLVPGARLHAVGVGSAPNRSLTRGAARAGRGVEILVGDDDDARVASRRLLQATVRPVLTDLEVGGPALVELAPARPLDVLEGQPLVLLAEIAATGGALRIQGKQAGTPAAWQHQVEIQAAGESARTAVQGPGNAGVTTLPLGALFGREAIEDMELELAAVRHGRGKEEAEDRIETLGLRHGIASRKTSLVAISEDPTVDPKDPRRRERLAVEVPAEVSAEGAGLMQPAMMYAAAPMSMLLNEISFDVVDEQSALMRRMPRISQLKRIYESLARPTPSAEKAPRRKVDIREARVLRLDGPVLVLEFEVPEAGFLLPIYGTLVHVHFADGSVCDARVLVDGTSRLGPHQEGLTVRLAIALLFRESWFGREAWLRWAGRVRPVEPDSEDVEVDIHIILGERP